MNKHDIDPELLNIAKNAIYTIQPQPLRFYFRKENQIVAVAGNLVELIDCVRSVDGKALRFHLFRMIKERDGFTPRSDLSLWVHYILGDIELSARLYELRGVDEPEELRKAILQACEERYYFFKDLLDTLE